MASQVDDDEDMDFDNWTPVGRGRGRGKGYLRKDDSKEIGNQNVKRSLEEDSSEEENRTVRRKMEKEEFKILLKFRKEDEEMILSPVAVSRELKKKLGELEVVKVLRDGNMLIQCKTEEQKNKAMQIDNVCKKVVCERKIFGENKVCRGVIYGIPIEEDLEKLQKSIQGGKVKRLKRLLRSVDGKKVQSLSVLLEFHGDVLPDKIKIGFMSFPVRPYVPPPLRCFKCQRYGHIALVCKGKERCAKCGGEHKYEECKGDQIKCCNCGGQHNVAYGGCEARKRAAEIQQLKTAKNISYAEAAKKVLEGKRTIQGGSQIQQIARSEQNQRNMSGLDITMDKLILFMAYVINCTDQVKQKTEKIKIIVKGAEKFFSAKDLSWELINKKLENDGKTGGGRI
uniref:Zn-dependent peptidases, insulinase domain-containing protein n=1 Tax=Fundulus heteroclitus TaxID=8078 RepID=A0A146QDP1_FUNHE